MLELAQVNKRDVLYDLGCGDGRIVIAAAKRYGCRASGFDIDPLRVKQSVSSVKRQKLSEQVEIHQQDLLRVDLRPATVITLYLNPRLNAKLIPQLEKLNPGSRIVSHQFQIPGVKPDRVLRVESNSDKRIHTLFLWTTPLNR